MVNLRALKISLWHCCLAVCLVGCGTTWFTPPTPTPLPSKSFPLKFLWETQTSSYTTLPLRHSGSVLLSLNLENVSALDTDTGKILWADNQFGAGNPEFWSVSGNSLIHIGSSFPLPKKVFSVDVTTGDLLWSSEDFLYIEAIAIGASKVFALGKGEVSALDFQTGTTLWRTPISGMSLTSIVYDYPSNAVYVFGRGDDEDKTYKLNGDDGQLIDQLLFPPDLRGYWSTQYLPFAPGLIRCDTAFLNLPTNHIFLADTIGRGWGSSFSEVILGNTFYFPNQMGGIRAMALDTQTVLWDYVPAQSFELISNLVVIGSTAYVMASDGTIRAIDNATGQEIGWVNAYSENHLSGNSSSMGAPFKSLDTDGVRLFVSFGDNKVYAFGP